MATYLIGLQDEHAINGTSPETKADGANCRSATHHLKCSASEAAGPCPGVDVDCIIDPEPVDISRLHRRLHAYATAYGVPGDTVRRLDELLATPLATRLLAGPVEQLYDILVTDAYKPRMHVMYDKFMNGVTADFALNVRRAPPAADPARLPREQPELWARFEAAAEALSRTLPYGPYEEEALRTQFGMELPESLLAQVHRDGAARVTWQPLPLGGGHDAAHGAGTSTGHGQGHCSDDEGPHGAGTDADADAGGGPSPRREERQSVEGGGTSAHAAAASRVAVASGPIASSSLVETSLMQRFQSLAVMAQVAALRRQAARAATGPGPPPSPAADVHGASLPAAAKRDLHSPAQPQSPAQSPAQAQPQFLDRSERLASSLVRLALTVQSINDLRHGCRVALFAGRRASDVLFLVLQNLYCAAHLEGYVGTSSVFVEAVVCREWGRMGLPERERWGGAGRLVGTHAHEQTSALQQLMAAYDAEAGRRCGLPHAVAITPLLSHLLFMAANGGGGPGGAGATALADTFTTPAFLAVARAAAVPAAFRRDVEAAFGWVVPPHATVFDLFRVWRLDSGVYEDVAEQVVAAWEARCAELAAEGQPQLPRPQLMHSNLQSVDHIAQVVKLDPRVRPSILAFGTLADGFLPFLPPEAGDGAGAGPAGGAIAGPAGGAIAGPAGGAIAGPAGGAIAGPAGGAIAGPAGGAIAGPAGGAIAGPAGGAQRHTDAPAGTPGDSATTTTATTTAMATMTTTAATTALMPSPAAGPVAAGPGAGSASGGGNHRPVIGLASVVMKLVQARPPRRLPRPGLVSGGGGGELAAGSSPTTASAAAALLPACAVKLGDGNSGKAQVDPRLPPEAARAALRAAVEMAHGSASSRLDAAAVSAVLAEAYEAVTRGGVLMRSPLTHGSQGVA